MNKMMALLWIIAGCLMLAYGVWQWLGTAGRHWNDGLVFYVFSSLFFGAAFYQNLQNQKPQIKVQRSEEAVQILYNVKECWRLLFSALFLLLFSAICFLVGWVQREHGYIALSIVFAIICVGCILQILPRLFNKEFMLFYPDGFILRGVGFVPWNDVEVIAVETLSAVFIFRLSEYKSVSLPFWYKLFRAFRRKGARVFLRISIHMVDKDPFEFYMICRTQYARYRSGARVGFDTPLKDIDRVIENEAHSVTFLTDIKKAASMF